MPKKKRVPAVIRDRVRELRRVRASELLPHPHNWRTHPAGQRAALSSLLGEIGYADALLARELPDGRLQLIDGHLRAETTPTAEVPVLVLDVTEEEAGKLLATLDPLSALAGVDSAELEALLASVEFDDREALEALSAEWNREIEGATADLQAERDEFEARASLLSEDNVPGVPGRYCVLIDCQDEAQQLQLLERLTTEGLTCRALIA